jgi:hypothetical protein
MISNTFGAPFGGTTVGGQYGVECVASRLMMPPKGAGGFGTYRPSSVVVALDDPGVPVISWAEENVANVNSEHAASSVLAELDIDGVGLLVMLSPLLSDSGKQAL